MIFQAPSKIPEEYFKNSIFLAGTIDEGNSNNWQSKATSLLKNKFNILNPRRDNWNIDDIYEQIEWELNALDKSQFILMHFEKNSKSPIKLLELGLYSKTGKIVVSCPIDFYRYENVSYVCNKFNIPIFGNILSSINYIKLNSINYIKNKI